MTTFPDDAIPRKAERAVSRLVEGEAVVVEPRAGMVHVLNATGSILWEAMDGRQTVAGLAALLARDYDVPPAQAAADTREFLAELERLGLLG